MPPEENAHPALDGVSPTDDSAGPAVVSSGVNGVADSADSLPGAPTVLRGHAGSIVSDPVVAAMHRIATELFSKPQLDQLLPEALAAGMDCVGALAGSVWLHDPRDDRLVATQVVGGAGAEILGLRLPPSQGVVGAVFRTGASELTGDAGQDSRHVDVAKDFETRAMITVPLRNLGGRTIGALQVLNRREGGVFSRERDLVILETVASLAATAIENAQQAERERKATVADMVGDIAHDIKNMMTPVESWASMMEMVATDSRAAMDRLAAQISPELEEDFNAAREVLDLLPDALEGIRDGAQQAKDRGAEIADALKGNVREPQFVCEDAIRTISRVCRTLKPSAEARGITLEVDGDCPAFPHDRTHLFNAVYNLVNNAIPYVPSAGFIRVYLSQVDEFAEILVADTGAGMPEKVRASLFTANTISTTVGGTGLGTGIVARVAKCHKGTVTVESELGKGSSFRLRIPLTRDEEIPPPDTTAP